ncbi:YybH family protein [Terriglobus aquaticus]|uniref:Nuclear transport factor 2 family protein n=1 Tax=Terriglobus aquaticus TaxID=940139 RepID=A0ABW9KMX2_9BACT|nr:nuclear transport factor 2 family protein [Terriglobus aquaticus]
MMRFCSSLLLATALLVPFASARAQNGSAMGVLPQAELDVVKVLTAQERAWNNGDMAGFLSGYKQSPETIFVGETVQHGSDNLAQRYHSTYPNKDSMGTLSFSDLQPRVLDDNYALVTGRFHLDRPRKSGGTADGVFSLVLEHTASGWKIILDHTS